MTPTIAELAVADEPATWAELGFSVEDDVCVVGGVRIRLAGREAGRGLVRWSLRGVASEELDGLPTVRAADGDAPPGEAPSHPNGVTTLDHVVAITPASRTSTRPLHGLVSTRAGHARLCSQAGGSRRSSAPPVSCCRLR